MPAALQAEKLSSKDRGLLRASGFEKHGSGLSLSWEVKEKHGSGLGLSWEVNAGGKNLDWPPKHACLEACVEGVDISHYPLW